MIYRVNATFNKKRIMTKKRFETKKQAQAYAKRINKLKPGSRALAVRVG